MTIRKIFNACLVLSLAIVLVISGCSSGANTGGSGDSGDSGSSGNSGDSGTVTESDMPEFAKIAGATSGGTYFLLANAMAQLFGEELPEIDFSAQSTPGSPKILSLLDEGGADLGIAQAGVADSAYNGKGDFEGNQLENISQVTYFYPNVMQLIVPKDAGIDSAADLAGKKVSVGAAGSATEINSRDLFQALDVNYPDGITAEYTSESQSVELLKNRQVQGANMIASLGSSTMLDLMSTGDYKILEFDKELIETLHNDVNPAYFEYEIPADTYPNQPEPIQTYAVANWLHARGDVSEDFVYEILKILYDNLDYMIDSHKVTENIQLESAFDGQTIPLHPGAVKFYEEQGIEIPEQ